jgi:hypothetical protein
MEDQLLRVWPTKYTKHIGHISLSYCWWHPRCMMQNHPVLLYFTLTAFHTRYNFSIRKLVETYAWFLAIRSTSPKLLLPAVRDLMAPLRWMWLILLRIMWSWGSKHLWVIEDVLHCSTVAIGNFRRFWRNLLCAYQSTCKIDGLFVQDYFQFSSDQGLANKS